MRELGNHGFVRKDTNEIGRIRNTNTVFQIFELFVEFYVILTA